MTSIGEICGAPLLYAIRFESANGLAVEIPARAVLSAGPHGELLVNGMSVTWTDAAMAPVPSVVLIVPADKLSEVIGVSPDAVSAGDAFVCVGTTHGAAKP